MLQEFERTSCVRVFSLLTNGVSRVLYTKTQLHSGRGS